VVLTIEASAACVDIRSPERPSCVDSAFALNVRAAALKSTSTSQGGRAVVQGGVQCRQFITMTREAKADLDGNLRVHATSCSLNAVYPTQIRRLLSSIRADRDLRGARVFNVNARRTIEAVPFAPLPSRSAGTSTYIPSLACV